MSALKGNPHFSAVELAKTAAVAPGQSRPVESVDFTLTAKVNYAPGTVVAAAAAAPAAQRR